MALKEELEILQGRPIEIIPGESEDIHCIEISDVNFAKMHNEE